MSVENTLKNINYTLHQKTLKKIDEIRKLKEQKGYISFSSYSINILLEKIFEELKTLYQELKISNDIELTFIDRNKFDSDICIKIPSLLQKYKWDYAKEIIPQIIKTLQNSKLKDEIISKVEHIWIYVNITLNDKYLFNSLVDIFDKAEKYWENDLNKWDSVIVEYSSPNVAKHLHAGHIRSTIIWHVLANLYDVNWYYTHRFNHINDWWGFWYLIEWYIKWKDILWNFKNQNDMLFFIYTLYRKWEKISASQEQYSNLSQDDILELKKYYWEFSSFEWFKDLFLNFSESGKNRFNNLESWEKFEVKLWQEMVKWSLADFDKFYNLLNIHTDYLIGESFYVDIWNDLITDLEKKWKVIFYTQDLADKDVEKLEKMFNNEEITEKIFESKKEEILRDIWAYVIPLENFERYVVLKQDKSSIYATRDLWAIKYRVENFAPKKILYEVWQEQAEHFNKLFASAKVIWIEKVWFEHIYHGFYVDAKTKKKLSSRDWASNVWKLISESIEYFKNKYKDWQDGFSTEEINDIAYKLAIWSIIFNDIKSDKKNPVLISSDIQKTCQSFEESWGAYVVYTIVRANSIISKIVDIDYKKVDNTDVKLDSIEKTIIDEINKYPLIVKQSLENNNPSTLVEFILTLSRYYNSYYNSHRVIAGNEIFEHRVVITKALITVLTNAMKICSIDIPKKM